jgi:hypothetical protein
MKIRPVGAELFHAGGRVDGRTDMTKLIVDFCNFANEPKNSLLYLLIRKSFMVTKGWLKAKQFTALFAY